MKKEFSKSKVLITGSNGLLGQKLIDLFLLHSDSFSLMGTSKGANRHPLSSDFLYQELDVTNREEVLQTIENFRPDYVIHTAAMTNVDQCETLQDECQALNVKSVEYLIEAAKMYDFHLMHLSTDFIFDGLSGPYKENDTPNPLSIYGKSKLDSENLIVNNLEDYSILRTILVYGIVKDLSRSNFVLWAKNALQKGEKIPVVNDQWRMPTLAEDLAQACFLVIEKEAKGIFHISGEDGGSIFELVNQIADYWSLDSSLIQEIETKSLNQPAKRPLKTGFDLSHSKNTLDYKPRTFKEGLVFLDKQLQEYEK